MYVVLTDSKMYVAPTLPLLNKQMDALMTEDEFLCYGRHYYARLSGDDMQFVQDKRKLSAIPMAGLFKADPLKYYVIGALVLQLITLMQIGGIK